MEPTPSPSKFTLNVWGLASLVLLVGHYFFWSYTFHMEDLGHPLFSRFIGLQLCVVAQVAAAACGIMAMRRGSGAWGIVVILAGWLAFTCFIGEL